MKRHFHLPLHMLITTKDAIHIIKSVISEAEKIISK